MAAPRKTTVEEEDLDDLDDVLEQFDAPPKPAATQTSHTPSTKDTPPPQPPSASASASQPKPDPFGLETLDDDFARELTKGMESLFRDIAHGAGLADLPDLAKATEGDASEAERAQALKAAWEAMLVDGMDGAMAAEDVSGKGKAARPAEAGAGEGRADVASFQENIKRAMERMKESNQKADEASAKGDDGMEDLFKQFTSVVESTESDDELQGILENMMAQLMSKDVLYEPLKELSDKFPSYLKDNESKLSAEDKTRYQSQYKVVAEIVATFEDPSYTDDDPKRGLKVVELMQQMQDYGSPPAEIMGPLPPGFDLGSDGMPKVPDCTIA